MNLAPIIHNAVMGGSKEAQEQGEHALIALRQQHPDQFLVQCAAITKDQKIDQLVRQSAATVLSRSLMLKDPTSKKYLWDMISPQSKEMIRMNLLNTLISASEKAKRGASNAISTIATIQVPRGEWQDLIHTMLNNASSMNEDFKRTSLMTIGFICQQFKQHSVAISETLESQILATLIKSAQDGNINTKVSALKAIRQSSGFMINVMRKKSVRDHIVNLLLESLKVDQTKEIALQGINEFIKYNFESLEDYIHALYNATFPLIAKASNDTVAALDLWDFIGFEYLERLNNASRRMQNKQVGKNLLLSVQENLVPSVLSCLIITDGEENTIRDTALKTMTTIAEACGKVVFNVVTTFVSNAIQQTDANIRQASALAFATLCECRGQQERKAVEELLTMAIDPFVALLADQNKMVVESATYAFIKFNEFYPSIFLRSPNYDSYINALLNCSSRSEKIAHNVIFAICNLTQGLNMPENKDCALAREPFPLLDKLTIFGFATKIPDIIFGCFMAITGILQSCEDAFLATNYIQHLINKYRDYPSNQDYCRTIRSGMLTAMHSAILVLRKLPPVDDILLDKIFAFTCYHFDSFRQVDSDGLYLISSIAITYGKRFDKHLDRAWGYIMHALSKDRDFALFKGGLICISDLARSLEEKFARKFDESMGVCLTNMQKNIDRALKCQIYLTLADCMISAKDKAENYKNKIIEVIDLGFQGVVELQNSSNDDFEYAEQLKQSVIDFYECVSASLIDMKDKSTQFRNHFPKLVKFVIMTTKRELNPTVDYLKSCMFLILDTSNCYTNGQPAHVREAIKAEIHRTEIKQIMTILSGFQNSAEIRDLLAYGRRLGL